MVRVKKVKVEPPPLFREEEWFGYTLTVKIDDGYINFAKFIEQISDTHPTAIQWFNSTYGTAAVKSFAQIHGVDVVTHYSVRKGIPQKYIGVYVHRSLIPSIMLWKDPTLIFFFGSVADKVNMSKPAGLDIVNPKDIVKHDISSLTKPESLLVDEANLENVKEGELDKVVSVSSVVKKGKTVRARGKQFRGTNVSEAAGSGSTSLPEIEIHNILVNLLQKPFEKARPAWLVNDVTGHAMELDMYNEELKIAVEYNGMQHYKMVKPYTGTMEKLEELRRRDVLKSKLCGEHGVRLIIVPYTVSRTKFLEYITSTLKALSLLPKDASDNMV